MFLVSHVETTVRVEVGQGQLEMTDGLHLGGQINVDGVLHLLRVQAVSLDVLLHVVALDEPSEKNKIFLTFEGNSEVSKENCKGTFQNI